jgi:hypothetical protein
MCGFFQIAIALLLLGGSFLIPPQAFAQKNLHLWNRHNLRDWLQSQRTMASREIESELPPWPEWRDYCPGVTDYMASVGREFKRLCTPVVKKNYEAIKMCVESVESPEQVLDGSKCLQAAGKTALAWMSLAKCTFTSYIVGADMTRQQKTDWETSINGVTDLRNLLALAEVFKKGDLALIKELKVPKSQEDIIKLVDQAKKIKKDLDKRRKKISKASAFFRGMLAGLRTIRGVRELELRNRVDKAAADVQSCRIERVRTAQEDYAIIQLKLYQQLANMREALALAEEQYYCAGLALGFESMMKKNPLEREAFVTGRSLDAKANQRYSQYLNPLIKAQQTQAGLVEMYEKLKKEVTEDPMREWRERRAELSAQMKRSVKATDRAVRLCESREAGYRGPGLKALRANLENLRKTPCGRIGLAAANGVNRSISMIDKTLTGRNNYDSILDRHERRLNSAVASCRLKDVKAEREKLQKALQAYERRAGFSNAVCYDARLARLDKDLKKRGASCSAQPMGWTRVKTITNEKKKTHDKRKLTSLTTEYWEFKSGTTSLAGEWRREVKGKGVIGWRRYSFKFNEPPAKLRAGEKITITVSGTSKCGGTKGCVGSSSANRVTLNIYTKPINMYSPKGLLTVDVKKSSKPIKYVFTPPKSSSAKEFYIQFMSGTGNYSNVKWIFQRK